METKDEMCKAHHAALQRIASALDLVPGVDIHQNAVPAINAIKASNNMLRAMIEFSINCLDHGDADSAAETLVAAYKLTQDEVMRGLEAEFDALQTGQMTPTIEMIVQEIHDEAGRQSQKVEDPFYITIHPHDYIALCDEEEVRDAAIEKRESSAGSPPDA